MNALQVYKENIVDMQRIVVYVRGGVVHDVDIPDGLNVEVEIRDYDILEWSQDEIDEKCDYDSDNKPYVSDLYG